MSITVIVELRARQGKRAELAALIDRIVAEQGGSADGYLGSSRFEDVDDPDRLVEVAHWESAEARARHMAESAAAGVYAPLGDLLAEPFRATVLREIA